jgi:phospholipase/carboxylesterase
MRKLGNIKCIEVAGPHEAGSNSSADQEHLIILFHGFGADAYDLQTLSDVLTPPWPANFLFPQGPLEVPIGPGWTGRAWWQIDMMAIQEAASRGETRDLSKENPEGLKKIRPQIMEMIEKSGVPWNRVILGGFSQGAMLATDIFLRAPIAPKGLIIFSGNLVCSEEWKILAPTRAGSKFFQSHGQQDTVLGHKGAARLETLLNQAGLKGRLHTFAGGHEIPMEILAKANEFLKTL